MSIRFRPGHVRDIDAMYKLDLQCFQKPFVFTKMTFHYLMRAPGTISFVARSENGSMAGFVILEKQSRQSACLATIDVHPRHRRRGLGKKLLTLALASAFEKGLFKSQLQVYVGNDAAISFYLGYGYRIDGYLPDFYARGVDACQMSMETYFPTETLNEIRDNQ